MKKILFIVIIIVVAYFAFGFGLRAAGTCPKNIELMPTVNDVSLLNGSKAGESLLCRAFFFLPTE